MSSKLRLSENDKMDRAAAMWAAGYPEQFGEWVALCQLDTADRHDRLAAMWAAANPKAHREQQEQNGSCSPPDRPENRRYVAADRSEKPGVARRQIGM